MRSPSRQSSRRSAPAAKAGPAPAVGDHVVECHRLPSVVQVVIELLAGCIGEVELSLDGATLIACR